MTVPKSPITILNELDHTGRSAAGPLLVIKPGASTDDATTTKNEGEQKMKNNYIETLNQTRLTVLAVVAIIIGLAASVFGAGPAPANDNFANAELISGTQVHISRSNASATKEPGEPLHGGIGAASVWFKWTATSNGLVAFSTNRSQTNLDTLMGVYRGSALNALTLQCVDDNIGATDLRSFCRIPVDSGNTYYIAVDGKTDGQTIAEGTFFLDIEPSLPNQGADYDVDGITDLSVFRPSNGVWYVNNSSTPQAPTVLNWGSSGDIPVISGDGGYASNTNAVFRPSDGTWYQSQHSTNSLVQWGAAGDIPVPANYGGGFVTNIAVFRPSNGNWYIRYGSGSYAYYQYGLNGDIPLAGHYSNDHVDDIAVFRPSNGTWYFIKRSTTTGIGDEPSAVKFGLQGDKPVPGDYDGDGILDIAVYRPSTGVWYVLRSSNSQVQAFHWGIAEDIPTTGDFDGDGFSDFAVFRPSNGNWYISFSSNNTTRTTHFGQNGDIPVTANGSF